MAEQRRFDIIINAVTRGLNGLRDTSNGLDNINKSATKLLATFGGIAAIGATIWSVKKDMDRASAAISDSVEATTEQMEKLNRVAKAVWEKGAADSIEAGAKEVIKAFQKAGDVSEAELFEIAKNSSKLAQRFNKDSEEIIAAADSLVKNTGVSWSQAFDIIATGFKKDIGGPAKDSLDTISEYGPQFKDLGLKAEEAFSIMATGAGGVSVGTDKVIDSLKEMKVKLSEMPTDVQKALEILGISSIEMQQKLESGTISLADAYKQILSGLQSMEEGTKRNAVGAALLGSQFEDMGTAAALGVDTAKYSMEDFEGAMDSVSGKTETLEGKLTLLWRGFLSGVASALDWINEYINVVLQADTVTQSLLGTIIAVTGAVIIWNLGLKAAIGLVWSLITALNAKIVALRVAAGSFASLTLAGQALLATMGLLVVVFAALAVGKAVSEFLKMREAMKAAEEAQKNLIENSKKWREEMESFKDFQMPEGLTGKTQEELVELQRNIVKARLYWITMRNELEKKAAETTILGKSTDEAKEAQKELEKVNRKINDLTGQLKKTGDASKEIKKVNEATKLSAKQMEEFEKAAKKAYEEATKEAAKYAKQVIDFEEKIKYARLSTEDKLRELGRKGLDEEQIWADKKLQAEEKLTAAKIALREQDYKQAEKLAKDAENLYADLAVEITKDDAVVKTIEQTKKVALAGVKETGSFIESVYTEQRDNAKKMQDDYTKSAETIKASLDQLAEAKKAKIAPEIDDAALKKAQDEINELTKDEIKIIKVKTVEAKSIGGVAGFSSGGKLPGYSRRDTIPALLTQGEWIINALSSRTIDNILPGFMAAINRVKSPADLSNILAKFAGGFSKFRNGGFAMPMPRVSVPVQRFQAGGQAQPLPAGFANVQNVGSLNVTVGGQSGELYGDRTLLEAMLRELGKRKKLGLQGV